MISQSLDVNEALMPSIIPPNLRENDNHNKSRILKISVMENLYKLSSSPKTIC